jgi:hypothetical protein
MLHGNVLAQTVYCRLQLCMLVQGIAKTLSWVWVGVCLLLDGFTSVTW